MSDTRNVVVAVRGDTLETQIAPRCDSVHRRAFVHCVIAVQSVAAIARAPRELACKIALP